MKLLWVNKCYFKTNLKLWISLWQFLLYIVYVLQYIQAGIVSILNLHIVHLPGRLTWAQCVDEMLHMETNIHALLSAIIMYSYLTIKFFCFLEGKSVGGVKIEKEEG